MITKDDLKKYFWAILGGVGMICLWAGVWDGIGGLPYLENSLVSLGIGIAILTFSGTIYKEFDPLKEAEEEVHKQLQEIHKHPQKHLFHIKYFDNFKNNHIILSADKIHNIEKGFIIMLDDKGNEKFIPGHRVKELFHEGKLFWKNEPKERDDED